jgi:hypothetical protein
MILGLPVPGRNTIGRHAGIKPSALHMSKRRETNHNQDCITEISRALNPSCALYIYTRIMHEMVTIVGTQQWLYDSRDNTSKLLPEQRSKGLQEEVTDPTFNQTTEGGYAIRRSKDNNALRSQKHNSDNPFRSPKLLFGNPKLLVDVDLRMENHLHCGTYIAAKISTKQGWVHKVLSKTYVSY